LNGWEVFEKADQILISLKIMILFMTEQQSLSDE
jgi:hypothetical protein